MKVEPTESTVYTLIASNAAGSRTATRQVNVLGPLTIITQSLDTGKLGVPYYYQLDAAGGFPPYKWSLASGVLPPGLSLDKDTGTISGTPTIENIHSQFNVKVTDSTGATATKVLSIDITPSITFNIANPLRNGRVGQHYSHSFKSGTNPSGGVQPYSFTLGSMTSLPSGLSLAMNGNLSGTPSVAVIDWEFVVCVRDGGGRSECRQTSITIDPAETPAGSTHTIITNSDSSCAIVPSGTSAYYGGLGSFNAIPVDEHSDICFRIISPPVPPPFTEGNLECPGPGPGPIPPPTPYCQVYVDGFPMGQIDYYCFTDVTEDHTITAGAQ